MVKNRALGLSFSFPRRVVKLKMLTQLDVRTDSIPIRPATFARSAGPSWGKKGRQMRKTDSGLPFYISATTRLASLSIIYSTRNYIIVMILEYPHVPLLSLALDFKLL